LAGELGRVLEHRQRFFQVDDVDTVTVAEDVLSHLGVPEAGLVTEMDTGFKHFTHADGHIKTPKALQDKSQVSHSRCRTGINSSR